MLLLLSTPDESAATTGRSRIRPQRIDPRMALMAQIVEEDDEVLAIVAALRSTLRI